MKGDPQVISTLNECLKMERTLAGCFAGYVHYFARERISRLKDWCKYQKKHAIHRAGHLMDRINRLDSIPENEVYPFDVKAFKTAEDLNQFIDYFLTSLQETRVAYLKAMKAARDADDAVTHRVVGRSIEGVEDTLWRMEAKDFRTRLIGAKLYLALHLHDEAV